MQSGRLKRTPASPLLQGALADYMLLLVPGLIWGASFLFIAEGLQAVGPSGVTFVRILVGFVTLSCFPAARKPVPPADWSRVIWLGVLWMAFPLSMFPFAEQRVSSAVTGMLNGANPLFTAVVATAITRRMPSRGVLIGLLIGMTGTTLVALPSITEGHSSAAGVGMILAALISYGFALNIAAPLQQRNGALPVIWRAQMAALVLTAPLGIRDLFVAHWTLSPVLALLALGAFGTAIAYVVLSVAAGRLTPTRASAATFLIPIVALALGVAVRHETVAGLSVLGSLVSLCGAWMMQRARTAQQRIAASGSSSPHSQRQALVAEEAE